MLSSQKSKPHISRHHREVFHREVMEYYTQHGRHHLPWRTTITPYRVLVSEIMLQQTQVDRVVPFFMNWMKLFPTFKKLAEAPQTEILRAWKGLGYNSRALRLKKTAEIITSEYRGKLPADYHKLLTLPGIGPYTAGALVAFSFNQPIPMIETNIRRVFLHHFYPASLHGTPRDKMHHNTPHYAVHDRDLLELIQQTLDEQHPREWYWALMDYGAYLGKEFPNANKRSRHYTIQKKFEGSDRQLRGMILEVLLSQKNHRMVIGKIVKILRGSSFDEERIETVITHLSRDGFLEIIHDKAILKR